MRWLCINPDAKKLVEPHGLRVENVTIPGDLDLRNIEIDFLLRLHSWVVMGDIDLRDARVRSVGLRGTTCRNLKGERATISGDLFIDSESNGHGLLADRVGLADSTISGNLNMTGAEVGQPLARHERAVDLARARIGGDAILRAPTHIFGSFRAIDVHIGGHFDAPGASVEVSQRNGSEHALVLVRAAIGGSVFLNRTTETETETRLRGPVSLWGARIGGDINCFGLRLYGAEPPESNPVDQEPAKHDIVPAHNDDVRPPILDLRLVRVTGQVLISEAHVESGRIAVWAADIGQDVACDGLFIDDAPDPSLREGEVTTGQAAHDAPANARPTPAQRPAPALEIVDTRIGGQLVWSPRLPRDSVVALTKSRVGLFRYYLDAWPTWPDTGQVWLDGFRYDEIRSAYTPYRRERLAAFARRLGADPDAPKQRGWRRILAPTLAVDETHLSLVRRHTQHTYDPQPYDALAATLRSMGRERDATEGADGESQ